MYKTLLIFLFLANIAFAQQVNASKASVNTCYDEHSCFSLSEAAYIFFDEKNHELTFLIDFTNFKMGNDTIDEWLTDLADTKLLFKGQLNADNLLSFSHNNSKTITVNGSITFNGVSHAHSIELLLFEIPQGSFLYLGNSQQPYDRISANLQFSFLPKEFKLNKKPHHLKKTISVSIYRGFINPLNADNEIWLKNKQ